MNQDNRQIIRDFAAKLIAKFQNDPELEPAELEYDIEVIEQAVAEYNDILSDNDTNDWKEQMTEWNKNAMKNVPDADPVVLQFIMDLLCHAAANEKQYEVIRSTFRAGYCYHFALMLKHTFKRGEVCWAAPFGHFVWVDTNGVPYDVEGINFGEQIYNIPESYLGDMINDFTHIPGNMHNTTEDEIIAVIRKYEDDNDLPHKELKFGDNTAVESENDKTDLKIFVVSWYKPESKETFRYHVMAKTLEDAQKMWDVSVHKFRHIRFLWENAKDITWKEAASDDIEMKNAETVVTAFVVSWYTTDYDDTFRYRIIAGDLDTAKLLWTRFVTGNENIRKTWDKAVAAEKIKYGGFISWTKGVMILPENKIKTNVIACCHIAKQHHFLEPGI